MEKNNKLIYTETNPWASLVTKRNNAILIEYNFQTELSPYISVNYATKPFFKRMCGSHKQELMNNNYGIKLTAKDEKFEAMIDAHADQFILRCALSLATILPPISTLVFMLAYRIPRDDDCINSFLSDIGWFANIVSILQVLLFCSCYYPSYVNQINNFNKIIENSGLDGMKRSIFCLTILEPEYQKWLDNINYIATELNIENKDSDDFLDIRNLSENIINLSEKVTIMHRMILSLQIVSTVVFIFNTILNGFYVPKNISLWSECLYQIILNSGFIFAYIVLDNINFREQIASISTLRLQPSGALKYIAFFEFALVAVWALIVKYTIPANPNSISEKQIYVLLATVAIFGLSSSPIALRIENFHKKKIEQQQAKQDGEGASCCLLQYFKHKQQNPDDFNPGRERLLGDDCTV